MKLCRFFKESSEEEREHAEKFMEYQVLNHLSTFSSIYLPYIWI